MGKKEFPEYYLGLDIGTDSIGWAVTDLEYNVLKFNGNAMWGIRLFDDAQTAVDRRVARVARRRVQRRCQRLALLQDLFAAEIGRIDPNFFLRMSESAFHAEDKNAALGSNTNCLFNDPDYHDADYHRQYPTIYHLRRALIEDPAPKDVRLVYLALHHIVKYRGHFLFAGDLEAENSLNGIMEEFAQQINEEFGFDFDCADTDRLKAILLDSDMKMSARQRELLKLFSVGADDVDNADRRKAFVKLLSGAKVAADKLFEIGECELEPIDFTSDSYDVNSPAYEAALGANFYFIEKLKAIYDWALLEHVLGGERYLCCAKAEVYDRHKRDLACLKRLIRKYLPREQYAAMFSDPDAANNYCAYAGKAMRNGKKLVIAKRCGYDDFLNFVRKTLAGIKDADPELEAVRHAIDARTFMPKATSKDNGVVPHQLHWREAEVILKNASAYLPFLSEKDGDGLTPIEKIRQIFAFRIPYYVGPLNDQNPNAENCWVERRSHEKIYPWNFDQIIDREVSADRFITRMTAKCTYLHEEDVLPKNSVLYSRFMVLNELNNLRIGNERLSPELKRNIFNDLFLHNKKVTLPKLVGYLSGRGELIEGRKITKEDISGVDGGFQSSMSACIELREKLGDAYEEAMAEDLIRMITVFGDDRKMLEQRIRKLYGDRLNDGQIRSLCRLRYTGWGRLSRALLTEIIDPTQGENSSIIQMMWDTNLNLMQLLSNDFGYTERINARNRAGETEEGFSYAPVRDLYASPSVKRQIWQTMCIVRELRKITGRAPDRLFIEMARGADAEKKRTVSRKNQLVALYKKCGEDAAALLPSLELRTDADLRSKRLYLYYTQLGRCMYTGEPISLTQLMDANIYDIDHIYPQSRVKDDSLSNMVLVRRDMNAHKSNELLDENIRRKMYGFWRSLLDRELISKKKFDRLTRCNAFTNDEFAEFINRQLVETRQTTKAVADMLKRILPDCEVVYAHAGNVSEFRQKFELLKCREVNDLHHAKDAYLNIVVGNVYHTKFTADPRNFFREKNHEYSLKRMYDFDVVRSGRTAWRAGSAGTIVRVKETMGKNNIRFTRMAFETHGALFDLLPVRKGAWQLPLNGRMTDPEKYGGYNKIAGSYFMLVEHSLKGRSARSIIDVPLHMISAGKCDGERLTEFMVKERGLTDPKILIPRVKTNALIEIDGYRMHVTGRTGTNLVAAPAHQLLLGWKLENYIRGIVKFNARAKEFATFHKGETLRLSVVDNITPEQNLELYLAFIDKLENTIYAVRLKKQAEDLRKAQPKFEALSPEAQSAVLEQILHLFACNRTTADLRALGLAGQAGVVKINRMISDYKSAKLIHQSITGLFEQTTDLLK